MITNSRIVVWAKRKTSNEIIRKLDYANVKTNQPILFTNALHCFNGMISLSVMFTVVLTNATYKLTFPSSKQTHIQSIKALSILPAHIRVPKPKPFHIENVAAISKTGANKSILRTPYSEKVIQKHSWASLILRHGSFWFTFPLKYHCLVLYWYQWAVKPLPSYKIYGYNDFPIIYKKTFYI